jgi:hypothetical protein
MTPEQLLSMVAARSLALAEPIGGAAPTWTLVEAGFAAAGLSRAQTAAFWHRYARDPGVRRTLYADLAAEAGRLALEQHWPPQVAGRPYLAELVQLAIAEETLSDLDRQRLQDRLPSYWPEGVWDRHLARRYRAIGQILDCWCAEAHWHMAQRMREDEG